MTEHCIHVEILANGEIVVDGIAARGLPELERRFAAAQQRLPLPKLRLVAALPHDYEAISAVIYRAHRFGLPVDAS